jgi:hypothetical protein
VVAALLSVFKTTPDAALASGLDVLFTREAKALSPIPEVLMRLASTLPAQTITTLLEQQLQSEPANIAAVAALARHAARLPPELAQYTYLKLVTAGIKDRRPLENLADMLDMPQAKALLQVMRETPLAGNGHMARNVLLLRRANIPGDKRQSIKTMKVFMAIKQGPYHPETRRILDRLSQTVAFAGAKIRQPKPLDRQLNDELGARLITAPSIGEMIAALWARIDNRTDGETLGRTLRQIQADYETLSGRGNTTSLSNEQTQLQQQHLEARFRERLRELESRIEQSESTI